MQDIKKDKLLDSIAIPRIKKGMYNRYRVGEQSVNLCNLFVDDTLKEYDIELPKMYETRPDIKNLYPGWDDAPTSPILGNMYPYFENRSSIKGSGVIQVDSKTAQKMANQDIPVIFLTPMHTTLVAPNDKEGIMVYRQDQAGRGSDDRVKVGVRDPDGEYKKYYTIIPNKYKRFNEYMRVHKGLEHSDITYGLDFFKSSPSLWKQKIEKINNFFNFLNNSGLGF